MPAIGSTLANVLNAAPPSSPAPSRPAAPPARGAALPGKMQGDTALFGFHQRAKSNSKQLNIPMLEAAGYFNLMPSPANMQAWCTWFNQVDRPGVVGPKTFNFTAKASITKESPNIVPTLIKVQQNLARRGYQVQVSGTFDAATERAVVAFKKAQGLHDGFRTADMAPAYTPFADERVQAVLAR